MSDTSHNERHEVEDRLTARAAADPAFHQQLVDDPQAAVRDELGVSLPPNVTITVLQETPDQLYLVLPMSTTGDASGELSDAELSGVAGGWDPFGSNSGYNTCPTCAAKAGDGC